MTLQIQRCKCAAPNRTKREPIKTNGGFSLIEALSLQPGPWLEDYILRGPILRRWNTVDGGLGVPDNRRNRGPDL